MAAAILDRFDPGTVVVLVEGSGGVLDIALEGTVVYSKKELGISRDEVNETEVCDAIFAKGK